MTDPYNQKAPPMKPLDDDLPAIQMPNGDEIEKIRAVLQNKMATHERRLREMQGRDRFHVLGVVKRLRDEFFHGKPADTAGEHALITLGDLDTLLATIEATAQLRGDAEGRLHRPTR